MNLKQLKEELECKLFNDVDNLVSDYRFAMKALDNLEKSNLHKKGDDYEY